MDSSIEYNYAYKATVLINRDRNERWKPNACDLVVLTLCEDYAIGLLPITFHSNRVTISPVPLAVQSFI